MPRGRRCILLLSTLFQELICFRANRRTTQIRLLKYSSIHAIEEGTEQITKEILEETATKFLKRRPQ